MFKILLADFLILPPIVFLIAKFAPRKREPEWVELNRFRAYLRTPEFMKRRDKLFETYQKGGDNHD